MALSLRPTAGGAQIQRVGQRGRGSAGWQGAHPALRGSARSAAATSYLRSSSLTAPRLCPKRCCLPKRALSHHNG